MKPETRYTKSGNFNIAYQVVGTGPPDLVLVPGWVSHIEWVWEEPSLRPVLSPPGFLLPPHPVRQAGNGALGQGR